MSIFTKEALKSFFVYTTCFGVCMIVPIYVSIVYQPHLIVSCVLGTSGGVLAGFIGNSLLEHWR